MDEARRVLDRLQRIELLDREGVAPEHLLAQVRALLVEAEAWVSSENFGAEGATAAVDRLRAALVYGSSPVGAGSPLS